MATSGAEVLVRGGPTRMGAGAAYAEERPEVEVEVADVWWDVVPVTNADFAEFVAATGHRTVAEQAPAAVDFPGPTRPPGARVAGLHAHP